jgi:hypothetical protein
MERDKNRQRFGQLLQAMVTQPIPSEKLEEEVQTSKKAASASYGDTRTRAGM